MSGIQFEVKHAHSQSKARTGLLYTTHGVIETPAFMPVGTYGIVKAQPAHYLEQLPTNIMLVNILHLFLRPGLEIIQNHGGIHSFTSWNGAILADSGGYQVYSMRPNIKVDERGIHFQDPLSGDRHFITPEDIVRYHLQAGVDIGMVLDVCPPSDATRDRHEKAVEQTLRWADRSINAPGHEMTSLFGIVQGGGYPDLRARCAETLVSMNYPGYAIGGLGIGENKETTRSSIEVTIDLLPIEKPRYLMGMGYPEDLIHAVSQGVDLFDCVIPTRNARNGQLFTSEGTINIKQSRFLKETGPPDPSCPCPVCDRYSLGYLCYLYRTGDMGAAILSTIHNLRYYLDFLTSLRHTIASNLPLEGQSEPI